MNLPAELLNSLKDVKGFDEKAFIEVHQNSERITSIRFNSFKPCNPEFRTNSEIPWCEKGFYLEERPSFTFDPLFHAGCYYVQEPGSMFIDFVIRSTADLNQSLTVLDLCGAPGGKATLVNDLLNENSILISNEVIRPRSEILSYNLSKWGTCNSAVSNNDPQVFSKMEEVFDIIVADVPCSGSGLFRKQPDALNEWSEENVNLCCLRQKRIISDALPSLKQNGIFIYSTCSYSKEENEDVVKWLLHEYDLELINIPLKADWGIVDTGFGYRFFPYLVKSEGFFCAVLRKKGESGFPKRKNSKASAQKIATNEQKQILSFVTVPESAGLFKHKEEFKLVSKELLNFREEIGQHLFYKKFGTTLGELKHDDFIPDHEFALSIYVKNTVKRAELSKDDAIKFLQKENLSIEAEKGLTLMSYKNYGLGWAKILDKRLNNYLPKDYRILSKEE